jgi:hypothetical protein
MSFNDKPPDLVAMLDMMDRARDRGQSDEQGRIGTRLLAALSTASAAELLSLGNVARERGYANLVADVVAAAEARLQRERNTQLIGFVESIRADEREKQEEDIARFDELRSAGKVGLPDELFRGTTAAAELIGSAAPQNASNFARGAVKHLAPQFYVAVTYACPGRAYSRNSTSDWGYVMRLDTAALTESGYFRSEGSSPGTVLAERGEALWTGSGSSFREAIREVWAIKMSRIESEADKQEFLGSSSFAPMSYIDALHCSVAFERIFQVHLKFGKRTKGPPDLVAEFGRDTRLGADGSVPRVS